MSRATTRNQNISTSIFVSPVGEKWMINMSSSDGTARTIMSRKMTDAELSERNLPLSSSAFYGSVNDSHGIKSIRLHPRIDFSTAEEARAYAIDFVTAAAQLLKESPNYSVTVFQTSYEYYLAQHKERNRRELLRLLGRK